VVSAYFIMAMTGLFCAGLPCLIIKLDRLAVMPVPRNRLPGSRTSCSGQIRRPPVVTGW